MPSTQNIKNNQIDARTIRLNIIDKYKAAYLPEIRRFREMSNTILGIIKPPMNPDELRKKLNDPRSQEYKNLMNVLQGRIEFAIALETLIINLERAEQLKEEREKEKFISAMVALHNKDLLEEERCREIINGISPEILLAATPEKEKENIADQVNALIKQKEEITQTKDSFVKQSEKAEGELIKRLDKEKVQVKNEKDEIIPLSEVKERIQQAPKAKPLGDLLLKNPDLASALINALDDRDPAKALASVIRLLQPSGPAQQLKWLNAIFPELKPSLIKINRDLDRVMGEIIKKIRVNPAELIESLKKVIEYQKAEVHLQGNEGAEEKVKELSALLVQLEAGKAKFQDYKPPVEDNLREKAKGHKQKLFQNMKQQVVNELDLMAALRQDSNLLASDIKSRQMLGLISDATKKLPGLNEEQTGKLIRAITAFEKSMPAIGGSEIAVALINLRKMAEAQLNKGPQLAR